MMSSIHIYLSEILAYNLYLICIHYVTLSHNREESSRSKITWVFRSKFGTNKRGICLNTYLQPWYYTVVMKNEVFPHQWLLLLKIFLFRTLSVIHEVTMSLGFYPLHEITQWLYPFILLNIFPHLLLPHI